MDLTFKINQIKILTIKSHSNLHMIKGKSWLDNSDEQMTLTRLLTLIFRNIKIIIIFKNVLQ